VYTQIKKPYKCRANIENKFVSFNIGPAGMVHCYSNVFLHFAVT